LKKIDVPPTVTCYHNLDHLYTVIAFRPFGRQ
jgi:hypothetical protein